MLLVLEAKAAAAEAAVHGDGPRPCAPAAAPRSASALGLERHFRDARAPSVMAPTTRPGLRVHRPRALRHGAVLMDRADRRRRGALRPEGLGDLGHHPRLLRGAAAARWTSSSTPTTSCRSTRCSTGTSTSPGTRRWPGSTRSAAPAARCRAIAMRDTDRDRVSHLVVRARRRDRATSPTCAAATVAVGAHRLAAGDADPARPPAAAGARARDATSRCGASTCWWASTATTSAASSTRFEALQRGEAAACAMLDLNWEAGRGTARSTPSATGSWPPPTASTTASSPCARTSRRECERRWLEALFSMSYDNPAHREMMDIEGLKAVAAGPDHRLRRR